MTPMKQRRMTIPKNKLAIRATSPKIKRKRGRSDDKTNMTTERSM